jgi:hypothetical protein
VNQFNFTQAVQHVRHVQRLLLRIQFKGLASGRRDGDVFRRRKHAQIGPDTVLKVRLIDAEMPIKRVARLRDAVDLAIEFVQACGDH